MIKTKQISHAELMQLGKMLLLLSDRQQNTMDLSSLTEMNNKVSVAKDIPRAS